MTIYDGIVVGGGPAGLSAAIYMARSNRSVLVIDKGDGRAKGKQINENYLGFPKGIAAHKLSLLGKEQAKKFGAEFCNDIVLATTFTHQNGKQHKPLFKLKCADQTYHSRTLIIATGVKDIFPSFPDAKKYIGKSIFWCIMCDGWKIKNKKVLVSGFDEKSHSTCLRLLNYTSDISLLINCEEGQEEIAPAQLKELKKKKIPIYYGNIKSIVGKNGKIQTVITDKGEEIKADYIFSKLGYKIQSDIAIDLEAMIETKGFIKTDKDQRTTIPFLYAAGDVTNDTSHQVVTAAHQGAVAAASADEDLFEKVQNK